MNIRHFKAKSYFSEYPSSKPIVSLPCEPWEQPVKPAEKAERFVFGDTFEKRNDNVRQRLAWRREQVARLVAQGKTRSEIRQAIPGLTVKRLEGDLAFLKLKPKSERGTK